MTGHFKPYFTHDQMVSALERIGYEVKLEEIEIEVELSRFSTEMQKRWIWNVYEGGEPVTVDPRLMGGDRVEFVFKRELEIKMLELFQPSEVSIR